MVRDRPTVTRATEPAPEHDPDRVRRRRGRPAAAMAREEGYRRNGSASWRERFRPVVERSLVRSDRYVDRMR